jgi:hypothetical protein
MILGVGPAGASSGKSERGGRTGTWAECTALDEQQEDFVGGVAIAAGTCLFRLTCLGRMVGDALPSRPRLPAFLGGALGGGIGPSFIKAAA